MINVTIYKDSADQYRGFMLKGHAGFAKYGSDIVCAAVSALTLNTVNSIDELTDEPFELDNDDNGGYLRLMFKQKQIDDSARILMDSLVLGLNGIRDDGNDKYIGIIYKEV